MNPTTLQVIWFLLISILWLGYFVLEGFDFGVGMLLRHVARTNPEKRAVMHTIGPVWDGNEVWLLVAGGATFAAFPELYATLFSGFYLALFLILAALIARGVAFEFWGKDDDPRWRATWEWALTIGSALPALLWGVAWANIIRGVPVDAQGEFNGTLLSLLNPYGLLGGVVTLSLFAAHGASFLSLRTTGVIEERSRAAARALAPMAAAAVVAFAAWTIVRQGDHGGVQAVSAVLVVLAALCGAGAALRAGVRPGVAFGLSALTILLLFCGIFADLYPNALVSTGPGPSLTLRAASSTNYTLTVMTVVAVVFVPIVLAYQAWTYWVFRARLGAEDFGEIHSPIDLLARHTGGGREADADEPAPTAPGAS
ncbi:cytochrome d ubiquinol oxidase subunit II [Baekduia soli]|uniref:Cytochrome d ubiquinol oxidase subunit II n=1 Tax=Baekduia soli TaxID=496014 RepID=A0A5B8UA36_9ACTN|nr:cytochrome d ubiquinol oxidase subunit II [Baekduia soli]QEC49834.1 cytochrome d ubiquinol oxidase subunit II [Baekduia soli]